MQTPPRARKRRNLAEELVLVLNERIRQGQLKRGDKLPTESEIMEQQGVSRTVVREAISRLQAVIWATPSRLRFPTSSNLRSKRTGGDKD